MLKIPYPKQFISCYGNYIPSLDVIIYSHRDHDSCRSTNYSQEQTNIYDISLNKSTYLFSYNTLSHNVSIIKDKNLFVGFGGVSQVNGFEPSCYYGKYRDGLYRITSTDGIHWTLPTLAIPKEWSLPNECCAFDSQSSIVYDPKSEYYHLYLRHNSKKGIRQIQVFRTKDLDKWENNAQKVIFDRNFNFYTQYIFKHGGMFVGIFRYYKSGEKYNQLTKSNQKLCIAQSLDGLHFNVINDEFIKNYKYFIHGDITQGHKIVNGKIVIKLLCQNGNINEYIIDI